MCGRFLLLASPEEIAEYLGLIAVDDFPPRYNIAPTQPVLVALASEPGPPSSNQPRRNAQLARWGFIPSWLKDTDGFPLLINARSETAAGKATFRAAMRHRRALAPASGFFEWKRAACRGQPSQAYWAKPADGGLVAFGALVETWHGADGSEIDTLAILTTAANDRFAGIHHRMPVTIAREDFDRWLDCRNVAPDAVKDLTAPPADHVYEAVPISDKVNKVANSGPDILQPVSEPAEASLHEGESRNPASAGGGQLDLF